MYKVYHIDKNSAKTIYIFNGYSEQEPYAEEITDVETINKYLDKKDYKNDKTKIVLVNDSIYHDDSIDFIKRKIAKATNVEYSFEELYLFGYIEHEYTNKEIYDILTQNGVVEITYNRLFQFLSNIYNIDVSKLDLEKDTYTFEDIILLNINNQVLDVKVPIGQRFYINNTYPVNVNPFDTLIIDDMLKKDGNDIVSTQNNSLLFDMNNIKNETIYLCTPDDIIEYINIHNESSIKVDEDILPINLDSIIKLYYPFLYSNDIIDEDTYKRERNKLIVSTRELLNGGFETFNKNVSLLREIYKGRKNELDYETQGIKTIRFTLESKEQMNIPLEIIFKLLTTSQKSPFVKYNPGKGRENMYRLFTDATSRDGRKIPLLPKSYITKLRNTMARNKGVSIHTIISTSLNKLKKDNEEETVINTTFYENGFVEIDYVSNIIRNVSEIEKLIQQSSIPHINTIENFLQQKGYTYVNFNDFNTTKNIVYNEIQYQMSLNITKKIKLEKYLGCLSSIINIISSELKSGIELRYKRVSYYNEMDAIEAYITRMVNNNLNRKQIIPLLESNFDLNATNAEEKYLNWLSNIQVEQQLHENKKLRIKSNPGFGIEITRIPFKNTININIDSINNIKYLDLIQMYLDSIIRITQDIESSTVPKDYINKVCKFKEVEFNQIEDIESKIEENLQKQTGVAIKSDELEFDTDIDDDEGLLGLLAEGDGELDDLGLEFGEEQDEQSKTSSASKKIESETGSGDGIEDGSEIGSELSDGSIEGLVFEGGSPTPTTITSMSSAKSSISQASDLSDLLDFGDVDSKASSISSKKSSIKKTKSPIDKSQTFVSPDDDDELVRDIVGLPLKNPNIFFQKMNERDPKLFLKRKTGKFNAYSRTCPMNVRRQPVILTDKEMQKIDKENPGSYSEKIKYGSSPDNQYWYICPRFWCLKTNTSMTEEDVKAGKCGGSDKIIPHGAKFVPKDAFVYEFTDAKEHIDQKGKYIQHYPGFVKDGTHPDGLCIPCCFKSWDAPVQQRRRDACLKGDTIEKSKKQDAKHDDYIKGVEKFPLDNNRWGYLPLSVQKILHTDNSKCYSTTGKGIKPFKYCMLRKGVELNEKQSFIACLADIYFEYMKLKSSKDHKKKSKIEPPSIKEMKRIIIDAIDIDNFISYFNGSLLETFYRESLSVNVSKYKDTKLYKNTMRNVSDDKERKEKNTYLKKIISSYENFIDYLNDDDVVIDHTYLWDIVHKPNVNLYPQGINLIILEIPNDDNTDNIEILCPTNNYSSYLFDTKKPTLILMKKEAYYEPIYIYRDEETNIKIHKLFSLYNHQLMPNLKFLLETIKRSYSKCQPLNSMPDVYKFENNLHLENIINILKNNTKEEFTISIKKQVIQYNQKVIGLILQVNEITGFLPIEPSGQSDELESIYIDEVEWKGLETTLDFLQIIRKVSKSKIPCLPKLKVKEDGLIIGIITETNQFIMLDKPHEDIGVDGLETIEDHNYYNIDKNVLMKQTTYDVKREELIKLIELESNYYNAFRNTLRMLLNNYEFLQYRKEIEMIIRDNALLYKEKITKLNEKIRELMNEYVDFIQISRTKLLDLDIINSCVNNKKCDTQYCISTGNKCKLLIPDKHLISNHNNETIYYYRVTDELIRYGFIQNYIFNPKSYLVLDKVDYKLQDNEVILLDTIMDEGYFDNLIPIVKNKYITQTSAEFIDPQKSVSYNNVIDLTLDIKHKTIPKMNCIKNVKDKVTGVWGQYFNINTKETFYKNTTICVYKLLLDLLSDFNTKFKSLKIVDLKNVLVDKYNKLIKKYGEERIIKKILLDQGKERIKSQILSRSVTLTQAIISEDYYLTNLDLIILAKHYDLPLVIISGTQMNELRGWNIGLTTERETAKSKSDKFKKNRKMWIVNKEKKYEKYYFIRQLGIKRNISQRYTLVHEKNSLHISVDDMTRKLTSLMNVIYRKRPSFDDYIKFYVRGIKKLTTTKLVITDTKEGATPSKLRKVTGKKIKLQQ